MKFFYAKLHNTALRKLTGKTQPQINKTEVLVKGIKCIFGRLVH